MQCVVYVLCREIFQEDFFLIQVCTLCTIYLTHHTGLYTIRADIYIHIYMMKARAREEQDECQRSGMKGDKGGARGDESGGAALQTTINAIFHRDFDGFRENTTRTNRASFVKD